MNQSIVIYGPQGCGKSMNAQRLARRFGLAHVVDDVEHWTQHALMGMGTLYLCNTIPPDFVFGQLVVYSFRQAMGLASFEPRPIVREAR